MNQPSTTNQPGEEFPAVEQPFGDAPADSHGSNTVINSARRGTASPLPLFSDQSQGFSAATSGIWKRLFVIPGALEADESQHGPAGIQLGHFQIEERIGSGGMGAVFRASDLSLQREVALKILSPHSSRDESSVQRFLNEARAAARLDHENIARVHYQGEDHGLNYIAFEYVIGQNIRELIQSNGLLDSATALNYTLQIAIALKHTNEAGVIHRDIKPSNIIITPNGRAKLVDLGLARKQNSDSVGELTVAGTTLGTFDYISPEQAKDPRTADVRSDIYSLGCTLYHMLTGVAPYPEGTVLQKLLDHQGKESPDPRQINPQVPPMLADVVKKMMSSQPKDRHATPDELIRELSHLARIMGLRGMHAESLVWQRPELPVEQSFWQKHLGWIVTATALILLVALLDRFPSSARTLVGTNNNIVAKVDLKNDGTKITPSTHNTDNTKTTTPQNNNPPETTTTHTTSGNPDTVVKQPAEIVTSVTPDKMTTEDDSKNPLSKPLPLPVVEQPAISIVGGETYKTLEAACLKAKDGDVIELAFNGRRPGPGEKSIRIANKKVTIRAGKNEEGVLYRPLIEFAPTEDSATDDLRLISLINGSIDLYDVDLSLIVSDKIEAENWVLFAMRESDKLRLQRVQLSVQNPRHRNVTVVELASAPGGEFDNFETMTKGNNGQPPEFDIKISESFIRGDCHLFVDHHVSPGRFDIEKSIITIDGTLLDNQGNHLDMPQEGAYLSLQLEHVTVVVGNSLIRMENDTLVREMLPVHVTADNNIIATNTSSPLVVMSANDTINNQRRLLRWQGEKNFYDQFELFWNIEATDEIMKTENRDFDGWLQIWTAVQDSSEVGAKNKGLTWQQENWLDKEMFDIEPAHLQLDVSTEALRILHAATDGSNIGADLSKFISLKNTTKESEKLPPSAE